MTEFANLDKGAKIRLVGEPLKLMDMKFKGPTGPVACTGDKCSLCKPFGKPIPKCMVTLIEKDDFGQNKTLVMDEEQYDKLTFKAVPKGRCLHLRLGKYEVRFWFMWWKLPVWDRRRVTTGEFQSWMFGPWEFRRY